MLNISKKINHSLVISTIFLSSLLSFGYSDSVYASASEEAKIILRPENISHLFHGNSTITFKNNDHDKGSLSIDIGTNMIEAGIIKIESNTTLLLVVSSEGKVGNLRGIDNSSKLDIAEDSELNILIDSNSLANIKTGESYAVISGFNITEETRKRIGLAKNNTFFNINGEDIKTSILYKNDSILVKFDKVNPIQESDEAEDL